MAHTAMVDAVNARLPKERQFGLLGWYLPKTMLLHREYKKLCPDGRLLLRVRATIAIALACLLTCAWALGFLRG
jgi:hypothetical protein